MPPSSEYNSRFKATAIALSDIELIFRHEFSQREIVLFTEALSDLSPDLIELAVKRIIRTRPRFRPTPGEIREAVAEELDDLERNNEHGMLAIADQRVESRRSEEDDRAARRACWNAEHPDDRLVPQWWVEQNPPPPRNSERYTEDPMRPMSEITRLLIVNRTMDLDRLPGTDAPQVRFWLQKMDQA